MPNELPEKLKMFLRLQPDEDGYPPFAVEGLWVQQKAPGVVVLDNIPFFAKNLAPGDLLSVVEDDGGIWFGDLLKSAGSSVFRISAAHKGDIARIREELMDLGLPSEVDEKLLLIAFEVPCGVDIRPVLSYLVDNQESERFDFEEGALRHAIPE
jgi:hypothetical protein